MVENISNIERWCDRRAAVEMYRVSAPQIEYPGWSYMGTLVEIEQSGSISITRISISESGAVYSSYVSEPIVRLII